MFLRNYILTVYLFLLYIKIQAQSFPNVQLIKETEGIPITNLISDYAGQIWIATTTNGLMRYHGTEMKKFEYDPSDSTSIKGEYILALYEDKRKKIWISSYSGDLVRYDPVTKKMKKFSYKTLLGPKPPENLSIVDMQNVHGKELLTVQAGEPLLKSILEYDADQDRIKVFAPGSKHPDYSYIFRSQKSSASTLIMGQDVQLYELNVDKDTITKFPFSHLQQTFNKSSSGDLKFDNQNNLWFIGSNPDLLQFKEIYGEPIKIYNFKNLIPNSEKNFIATSIALDNDQNIWIGSYQGLIFYNRATSTFKKIELPLNINDQPYKVTKIYIDYFQNVWIGTTTGLLKYENKPIFNSYSGKSIDTSLQVKGFVFNLSQLKDGTISFISSEEELDGTYKPKYNLFNPITNKLQRLEISEALPKGANYLGSNEVGIDTLNIGTDRGVFQFTNKGKVAKKINLPGVPNTHPGIWQFYKDIYGNDWLGSLNYFYNKLKGTDTYKPIDLSTQPGGSDQSNLGIVIDGKQHGLWMITNNGLFLYDYKTNKITRHGYDPQNKKGFITQEIASIYTEDSTNIVWVGIKNGGLNKYDILSGKIKTFTTEHGLPHLTVSSIIHDEKNNSLWLGTEGGISKFNKQTERLSNFSKSGDINLKSIGEGIKIKNGQLFFGGRGLIRFTPDDIKSESLPPLVTVTDIKVGNNSILGELDSFTNNTLIELKHKQNNIRVEYLVVHYTDPTNNETAYRLEGFETEWNQVNNQNTAYYTNLAPGNYKFHIKAANSNGQWNEAGASLHIKIMPPWWRTNLAYLFYLIATALLAKLGNQYYKHRVLEQERARSQAREIEQAKEIEQAYKKLELSHNTLQSTQAQLIQSEKMASLGELTAGIAHEIQNPLNFVNNFSELNNELVIELNEEIKSINDKTTNKEEIINIQSSMSNVQELIGSIKENSQKIYLHGLRASSIIKGMLEHSRKSSGEKTLTDINALCDEYLRLSYHGLRAKDKSFNADFKTDLDPNMPKINVVSQDIARVLLNIINNAFQACLSKSQIEYKPLVILSTKYLEDNIEISISDNGPGIPHSIKDKIFQPFFTTKPTGQGTGLGLSLAYDIVKIHGGTIQIKSYDDIQGETHSTGTEFIIKLPMN